MANWTTFDLFLDEALTLPDAERQALVDQLLAEHRDWPWISDGSATFILERDNLDNVAVNLDTLPGDPPFAPMDNLPGTRLWYTTLDFARDDLLDYLIAVDDPMTPLAEERDIAARVAQHWNTDALNPLKMEMQGTTVSVLRMSDARPFPDWNSFQHVARGRVTEHTITSQELDFDDRRLWVYTPPGYEGSGSVYPLLVLQDGQWMTGPLQLPAIADALIKHQRMQPIIIAMVGSGAQADREREYGANEMYTRFLLTELLPFVQTRYYVDAGAIGVGGVAAGAVAAISAALPYSAVFSRLLMISPPLARGANAEALRQLVNEFDNVSELPSRIFQSVGRYEARARFYRPATALSDRLLLRRDLDYRFVETGSGHGLVGFRSVLPEGLAFLYPGAAFG